MTLTEKELEVIRKKEVEKEIQYNWKILKLLVLVIGWLIFVIILFIVINLVSKGVIYGFT